MRACTMLLPVLLAVASAVPPTFGAPSLVQSSGVDIDVGYYGAPCMADWNGDGKSDLVLGEFSLGKIRLYLNSGTADSPVFTGFTYLQSDGADITLPYG